MSEGELRHNLEQAQTGLVREFQDHQETKRRVARLEQKLIESAARIEELETALTACWGTLTLIAALREQGVPEKDWEGVPALITKALHQGAQVMGFTPEVIREALSEMKEQE